MSHSTFSSKLAAMQYLVTSKPDLYTIGYGPHYILLEASDTKKSPTYVLEFLKIETPWNVLYMDEFGLTELEIFKEKDDAVEFLRSLPEEDVILVFQGTTTYYGG